MRKYNTDVKNNQFKLVIKKLNWYKNITVNNAGIVKKWLLDVIQFKAFNLEHDSELTIKKYQYCF